VTFAGADSPGSGIDRITYTTNGSDPARDDFEYTSGIVVRSLTHLKVRAFDRAGNSTGPVSLTIRSLADRLAFGAPVRVTVPGGKRYVRARLSSSQRTQVVAVMTGRGLAKPVRWSFILKSGTWVVQLRLPGSIARGRAYTVRWTVSTGTKRTTRVTQIRLG
jgi:hypothetical protein